MLGRVFPQLSVLFSREINSVELTSQESCRWDRACPARARASLRTALHRSGDRCHMSCPCHLSARTCRPALRLFPRTSGHRWHRWPRNAPPSHCSTEIQPSNPIPELLHPASAIAIRFAKTESVTTGFAMMESPTTESAAGRAASLARVAVASKAVATASAAMGQHPVPRLTVMFERWPKRPFQGLSPRWRVMRETKSFSQILQEPFAALVMPSTSLASPSSRSCARAGIRWICKS
jgi:hypothetical protein